ncbi:sterigmatocystin 8-O-methyltransferase [Biscogniauxia marginata]|nr:sterigmatocystin 8-O-methyltransferase [Biscogniauxia marginata]
MASPRTAPRMIVLAAKISSSVAEFQELLSAQGVPSPSFAEDSPECLPAFLMSLVFKFSALSFEISNLVSIDAICRFRIADMIPPGGQTGLEEPLVRRLLRHAMAMRIFREPEPAQDGWPASARMVDAMQKWPSSEEPNETGFSLANNTDKSVYEVLSEDPMRAMRFASSMKSFDHFPGYAITEVPKLYDWASLNNAFIVDVGGSKGHVAIELAKSFGGIKLLVQDIEMVVEGAESSVPDQLRGRVEFMAHGLFDSQPVQADVYFFRLIFHNWADKYALRILKAHIPALRPGAMILIRDAIMPDPGHIPLWRERDVRAVDLNMGCFFNARERYLHEWKALLAAADERFVLQRVIEPEISMLAILEVIWDAPGSSEA